MKTSLNLKINPIWEYLGLIIYPIKPSAGLFFLIKSRETVPLITGTLCPLCTVYIANWQNNVFIIYL
jgi:hypothetical protein